MLPNVIRPARELPDSHVGEEFTAKELDAIAPLAPGDAQWFGEFCRPPIETVERMDRRIKAAKKLKYGVCE